jgi:hypothetical protein
VFDQLKLLKSTPKEQQKMQQILLSVAKSESDKEELEGFSEEKYREDELDSVQDRFKGIDFDVDSIEKIESLLTTLELSNFKKLIKETPDLLYKPWKPWWLIDGPKSNFIEYPTNINPAIGFIYGVCDFILSYCYATRVFNGVKDDLNSIQDLIIQKSFLLKKENQKFVFDNVKELLMTLKTGFEQDVDKKVLMDDLLGILNDFDKLVKCLLDLKGILSKRTGHKVLFMLGCVYKERERLDELIFELYACKQLFIDSDKAVLITEI